MAGYNWNTPTSLHQVTLPQGASGSHIDAFIRQHEMTHGDVISDGEHRMNAAKIVNYDESNNMYNLVENPDESGSGYLTVPETILCKVTDTVAKYNSMINNSTLAFINFKLSLKDKFVTDRLGNDLPDGYRFEVQFSNGERGEFLVSSPGGQEFHSFEADDVTWQTIVDFFEVRKSAMIKILVKVDLMGEDLKNYEEKYGQEDKKYAWMTAKPGMPSGWTLEKAGSSGGTNKRGWLWNAHGPAQHQPEARHALQQFLQGFKHEFKDN